MLNLVLCNNGKYVTSNFLMCKERFAVKCFTMISLPDMWWGFIGSLDMLEYEAMRSPMNSQGAALLWDFLDLSRPWESLDEIYGKGLVVI